jgi:SAM-dependent methyltransferase
MTAEYFDQWYADIGQSAARQQLFTDHLGLPPEVGPSNLVPLAGLREIAAALGLDRGGVLVDLACGRGGPGMWLARERGAALIGVDFSAEAIRQATARRKLFGLERAATFSVGRLEATGLAEGVADAVTCIDAFQFAPDGVAAAAEIRRVVRPGGIVAMTCWEPFDRTDAVVGERIRKADLAASLTAAGFTQVTTTEKPEWYAAERLLWHATLATDPAGDPALESLRAEAERAMRTLDRCRRIMTTALAP